MILILVFSGSPCPHLSVCSSLSWEIFRNLNFSLISVTEPLVSPLSAAQMSCDWIRDRICGDWHHPTQLHHGEWFPLVTDCEVKITWTSNVLIHLQSVIVTLGSPASLELETRSGLVRRWRSLHTLGVKRTSRVSPKSRATTRANKWICGCGIPCLCALNWTHLLVHVPHFVCDWLLNY